MNFTCQKRIEIKIILKSIGIKSIWLNFKFIIRYILEHFLKMKNLELEFDDVSKLALYVYEKNI